MKVMAKQQAGLAKSKVRFVKENTLAEAVAVSTRALRLGGPELAEAPLSMMIIASHRLLEGLIQRESLNLVRRGEKGLVDASDEERSDLEDEKEIQMSMKWIVPVSGQKSAEGRERDKGIMEDAARNIRSLRLLETRI